MTDQIFRTRTQWFIIAMGSWMSIDGAWALGTHFLVAPERTFTLVLSALQLLMGLPMLLFLARQSLRLTDTELILHHGLLRQRVAIDSIKRLRGVDARGDSIIKSKHSIELKYGTSDSMRVSPVDHEAFITALRTRNSQIIAE